MKLSYLLKLILLVRVFSILLSIFHGRLKNRSSRIWIALAFFKPYFTFSFEQI